MTTGFLEESPGVKSSSRLFTFILVLSVVVLVGAACVYLLRPGKEPNGGVIAAWATIVTAVGGCGALVHWKRNDGATE